MLFLSVGAEGVAGAGILPAQLKPTRNRIMHPQHTREVVSPQGSDLVLTAHVPNVELGVLVGHGFDVESHGWDRRDVLVELELVEDCYNRYVSNQSLVVLL
jgi:hypothetical protein